MIAVVSLLSLKAEELMMNYRGVNDELPKYKHCISACVALVLGIFLYCYCILMILLLQEI